MAKPQIQVVSIASRELSTQSNNIQITIIDGSRVERILNLSPQAQEQLLQSLLANPVFKSNEPAHMPRNFLVAGSVRVDRMPDKRICLEVRLSDQIAVHILLPGILPDVLLKALQEASPPGPLSTAH